ncbi:MAG TPA: transposase [Candidatus Binatia bacterium]|nr:transposase [Candidatus Binatia bacterium]
MVVVRERVASAPDKRPGVPHRSRAPHSPAHPVHVTLRARSAIRCLRAPRVFPHVRAAIRCASRNGFRILHFSVQDDHLHLIAEADDGSKLGRGLRGLAIRVARAVNRGLGRHGAVWGDRYHARPLTTPWAVRHGLVYVLMNRHKHHPGEAPIDPCSSAPWFDGWQQPVTPVHGCAPVARARTWLAAVGWRRRGLLALGERPRGSA